MTNMSTVSPIHFTGSFGPRRFFRLQRSGFEIGSSAPASNLRDRLTVPLGRDPNQIVERHLRIGDEMWRATTSVINADASRRRGRGGRLTVSRAAGTQRSTARGL